MLEVKRSRAGQEEAPNAQKDDIAGWGRGCVFFFLFFLARIACPESPRSGPPKNATRLTFRALCRAESTRRRTRSTRELLEASRFIEETTDAVSICEEPIIRPRRLLKKNLSGDGRTRSPPCAPISFVSRTRYLFSELRQFFIMIIFPFCMRWCLVGFVTFVVGVPSDCSIFNPLGIYPFHKCALSIVARGGYKL